MSARKASPIAGSRAEHLEIVLADQIAGDFLVIETRRQPMHDGAFERLMVEDGRQDEAGEFRLAPHDFFGFGADMRKNRIGPRQSDNTCAVRLSHVTLLH